ncbi:MAG: hypothetical protein K6F84_07735 [Lachnospiraceae bacterium]|nr:hypothetical protein [Lachnospiraceae bacterium]
MKKFKDRFAQNMGLKIASVVLAFLLWFLVVQIENPQGQKSFSNIPVILTNSELLDAQGKVYTILEDTDKVRVTVWAPENSLSQIRASDIVAEADMSKLTDINTVAITYSVQNVPVDEVVGNHDVVKLEIREKKSKYVNLTYETVGEVTEGYMVGNISLDQNRIEVSGPEDYVSMVKSARAVIDVTDAVSNLSANVEIKLLDAQGNEIPRTNITTNVSYVHMSVEILATKEVSVTAQHSGVLAEGYEATGEVTVTPDTVVIAGTPAALSLINEIKIPADFVNVTGLSEDTEILINLKDCLPENVRLADPQNSSKVTASVKIEPIVSDALDIDIAGIQVENVPDGFKYRWGDKGKLSVKIKGRADRVEELKKETPKAKVVLNEGLGNISGEQTVDVIVDLDLGESVNTVETPRLKLVLYKDESN